MSANTFSLVFLTYNRLGIVARCFRSLAPTLALPGVEWLILDNASTDGTATWVAQLAARYPDRVRVQLSGVNLGVAGGRKVLFEQARGNVIISLDSDVEAVRSGWLSRLRMALERPGVELAGPGGAWVLPSWMNYRAANPHTPGVVDVVSGYCQAFRRSLLAQEVALDQAYNLRWHEDSDMCLQIAARGGIIWHTGDIGLRHVFANTGDDGSGYDKQRYLKSKWSGQHLVAWEQGIVDGTK